MNEALNTPNNSEIEKALKEFEVKSMTEQGDKESNPSTNIQKEVAGIKFETESYAGFKYVKQTNTPKIIKLVMKSSGGIIKEEKYAEYLLLGLVLIATVVSLFLFFGDGIIGSQPKPNQETILRINNIMNLK